MATVGFKSRKLLGSAIAMIVLSAILIAMFVLFAVAALMSGEAEDMIGLVLICVVLIILFAVLLGIYIPMLIRLRRSPMVLIARQEGDFHLWCDKDGNVTLPCDAVAEVKPIRIMMTANLITVLSNNYDATLQITTTDGRIYKVPYVQEAKRVSTEMMRIAFEVRAQKEILAFKAGQQGGVSENK